MKAKKDRLEGKEVQPKKADAKAPPKKDSKKRLITYSTFINSFQSCCSGRRAERRTANRCVFEEGLRLCLSIVRLSSNQSREEVDLFIKI